MARTPSKSLWEQSYPPDTSWAFSENAQPLHRLLQETAQTSPNKTAIHFMGGSYTYQQLWKEVQHVAHGLQEIGVQKGTKVGIYMPNCPVYPIFYYGIVLAGGIVINYSPLYAKAEIEAQAQDSGTEFMVTLDLQILYPKVQSLLNKKVFRKLIVCSLSDHLPLIKNLLFGLFKGKEKAKVIFDSNHIDCQTLCANTGTPKDVKIVPEQDLAVIQYTGGTTGVPKGAMLTHSNLYLNVLQIQQYIGDQLDKNEKILAALPFFHVFAMTAVMNLAVKIGAEIIMMFPRFDSMNAMKLIEKHKVTLFPGVPTIFNLMIHDPQRNRFDLSSLKACLSGGASLPVEVMEKFQAVFGCQIIEGYGLSETSPVATLNPPRGLVKGRSIGLPLPGTCVKILSLENPHQEMLPGETGEICIKGPQVMKGYYNRPDETKSSIVDDFFHSGDIGYMDEDGYLFLVDRLKDVIMCNGYNVYPRHVEDAIHQHPATEEVIVLGLPHEIHGKTVSAFIKLKEGKKLSQDSLLEFLKDKLSVIEIPRRIEFRDNLPKTPIGKLSKKDLLEEILQKSQQQI